MDTVLVSATELAEELVGDRPPVVLDVRWSLAGSDLNSYRAGHIPGAVFLDLDRELAAPVGDGRLGRHPLPDPADLQESWRRAGIRATDSVVVYDARDASAAARAWWLLRWSGVAGTRVLDGGLAAWEAAGLRVKAGAGTPLVPGNIRVRAGGMPTVDADQAGEMADQGRLLDARAAARYRGEVEPIDPAAGHIPGAVNLPFTTLVGPDGRFRPAAEIRQAFAAVGITPGMPAAVAPVAGITPGMPAAVAPVAGITPGMPAAVAPVAGITPGAVAAASCGSGVTACHLVLAGAVAGIELALYPGSWSQWCALGRPVEVGPAR